MHFAVAIYIKPMSLRSTCGMTTFSCNVFSLRQITNKFLGRRDMQVFLECRMSSVNRRTTKFMDIEIDTIASSREVELCTGSMISFYI